MNKKEAVLIKNLSVFLLSRVLFIHLPERCVSKMKRMLATGFEAWNADGKKLQLEPIGLSLAWMMESVSLTKIINPLPDEKNPIKTFQFTGKNIGPLLAGAPNDSIDWEAAQALVAYFLTTKQGLPDELRLFHIDVLNGKIKFKGRRGRIATQKHHRNAAIIMVMAELARIGYGPIAKSCIDINNTISLCDVMSEALQSIRIDITYEGVRSIWENRKSLETEQPQFHLDFSNDGAIIIGFAK